MSRYLSSSPYQYNSPYLLSHEASLRIATPCSPKGKTPGPNNEQVGLGVVTNGEIRRDFFQNQMTADVDGFGYVIFAAAGTWYYAKA